jgi:hypothetical protein
MVALRAGLDAQHEGRFARGGANAQDACTNLAKIYDLWGATTDRIDSRRETRALDGPSIF